MVPKTRDVCSIAKPANRGSPNAEARRCSIANSQMTRPPTFWSTLPRVAAFAEPVGSAESILTPSLVWGDWQANMLLLSTTAWWDFPPQTLEVQLDEKWSFVAKKKASCDGPNDAELGDRWDHVAFDPEHRLVLGVIPGKRTLGNAEALVEEVNRGLGGRTPRLITSDAYPAYETAILHAYIHLESPPRTGKPWPFEDPKNRS